MSAQKPSSPYDLPFLVSENEGDLGDYLRTVQASAIAPVPDRPSINGAPIIERDKEHVVLRVSRKRSRR